MSLVQPDTASLAATSASARAARSADGERRCVVTRRNLPKASMVRFVADPDGSVVPDVTGRLPGRGMWVEATRASVDAAATGRLFSKAAKRSLKVEAGLVDRVGEQLAARTLSWISLARRAGEVVCGHEKVRAAISDGRIDVLVQAVDGRPDSRNRMRALAGELPSIEIFTSPELAGVLGRDHVVHAALLRGTFADRFLADAVRLAGFRPADESRFPSRAPDVSGESGISNELNG